jgi:hypothetical protein
MGAIVTSKFRTQNLMVFIDQFKTTGVAADDNFLYLGFGRSDAWANDVNGNDESNGNFILPDPLDEDEARYWTDIVGAKRIQDDDISPVLPRIDWDIGDPYAFDGSEGVTGIPDAGRSFVSVVGSHSIAMNSEYRVYECVREPGGSFCSDFSSNNPTDCTSAGATWTTEQDGFGKCYIGGSYSATQVNRTDCEAAVVGGLGGLWLPNGATQEPTSPTGDPLALNAQVIETTDAYAWKYLYKLELNDIINSTTNDWMPVIYGDAVLAGSEQYSFGDPLAIFSAKCHHGLIHVRLETSDGFPDNDDFRQIGLLRNPELDGGGSKAQSSVYPDATLSLEENTGQLIYLENRRAITRAPDQIEDLKLVVEF